MTNKSAKKALSYCILGMAFGGLNFLPIVGFILMMVGVGYGRKAIKEIKVSHEKGGWMAWFAFSVPLLLTAIAVIGITVVIITKH